jgi:hypothetical protein
MSQTTTATNIQGPDLSTSGNTQKYFNNFYAIKFDISSNANAAILAFFEQYADNKAAAKNLAAAVVYTALAQNIDPLKVLDDFQKLPKGHINTYLIAFLNANRVPTSMLGLKDTTATSPYVLRTILP